MLFWTGSNEKVLQEQQQDESEAAVSVESQHESSILAQDERWRRA